MSALIFHILIFDSFYNKELIHYLISLDEGVVLVNCGFTGPDNAFIYQYV